MALLLWDEDDLCVATLHLILVAVVSFIARLSNANSFAGSTYGDLYACSIKSLLQRFECDFNALSFDMLVWFS